MQYKFALLFCVVSFSCVSRYSQLKISRKSLNCSIILPQHKFMQHKISRKLLKCSTSFCNTKLAGNRLNSTILPQHKLTPTSFDMKCFPAIYTSYRNTNFDKTHLYVRQFISKTVIQLCISCVARIKVFYNTNLAKKRFIATQSWNKTVFSIVSLALYIFCIRSSSSSFAERLNSTQTKCNTIFPHFLLH